MCRTSQRLDGVEDEPHQRWEEGLRHKNVCMGVVGGHQHLQQPLHHPGGVDFVELRRIPGSKLEHLVCFAVAQAQTK